MRRLLGSFAATLLLAGAANAGGEDKLIGLWEGMDERDGSDITVSIRDLNDDGTLEFSWRESSWSFCNNTERAILQGSGTVDDGVLTSSDTKITCFDETVETKVLCFGFLTDDCDVDIGGPYTLEFNKDSDVLINDGDGTAVLHRTSSRVRHRRRH
jgi:hypothetical protein